MRLDTGFLYCTSLISLSGSVALERCWRVPHLCCYLTAFPEAHGECLSQDAHMYLELPEFGAAEQLCLLTGDKVFILGSKCRVTPPLYLKATQGCRLLKVGAQVQIPQRSGLLKAIGPLGKALKRWERK